MKIIYLLDTLKYLEELNGKNSTNDLIDSGVLTQLETGEIYLIKT